MALFLLRVNVERPDVDAGVRQRSENAAEDAGFVRGDHMEFDVLVHSIHGPISFRTRHYTKRRPVTPETFSLSFWRGGI
jgi:hypothetical protein